MLSDCSIPEEKAAHAKTQAHLLQTLEAMKQQAEAAEEHEKTFKSETGRQLQNYRNQISTVIREFQDTVAVCFVGIESVEKLLASEAPKIPSQGTSDTGAFWKALEVLLEALHGIIREGDETLLEPIKTIKHIAEEKTAGMVERASKLVPQLRQRAEECEQCMNSMKNSLTKLQEQAAVSAPSLKSLTRQLWSSWYSSANFARSLHGTVTETVKDALELRKLIDEDTKQNDQSLRYSKLLRGLEEAKSRLELQMDMCSALGQTLSKLFLEIAGRQMREHENEAPETKCGDDRSPFTGLGADSFIKDLAKSLEAEEVSVKERLDLELEMTKLKSKLKSEQVARIWRDKYIREFVNKYNAHFDGSLLVSKEVQTVGPMMFALRPELQNDAAASEFQTYWADLLEQAKKVSPLPQRVVKQTIADIYSSRIKYVRTATEMPAYLGIYFHSHCEHILEFMSSILKHKDIPEVENGIYSEPYFGHAVYQIERFGKLAGIISRDYGKRNDHKFKVTAAKPEFL
ncbi:uncharacterized protein LOC112348835 [Selaginella moellendorffii]|uniref:uncharacterized protein LOC112348835 n=1 Tax=Selaginella moellendorffii TaxID=88036 RepID=UPI000D1C8210|nr:uncharacterized protein LOC112348835 [Selaginella moellendorffii]|eukprot:XP_024537836.1 uncharacterized protein LOC112348835 [Selaginella moellendorffii]